MSHLNDMRGAARISLHSGCFAALGLLHRNAVRWYGAAQVLNQHRTCRKADAMRWLQVLLLDNIGQIGEFVGSSRQRL
jgi:hypothetical protein